MAYHDSGSLSRHGERLKNVTIAHLILSWLFIGLRAWTRCYVKPNFGRDDCAMILAGMIFTSYCGCIFYIESHGGGTHVTSLVQLNELTKRAVASEATYVATVMVLKISVGIFFARIVVKRWQFTVVYTTVAISCISATATFFYVLFRCGSDMDQYVLRQLRNDCAPRGLDRFFAYQHAAFAFSTDCVFVLLPIPLLWHTNMRRAQKFSVGLILSLAALGSICSAIRFRYVNGLTQIEDFFWNTTNVSIWSTIEAGAGIISGCMATLRPLVKEFMTKFDSLRSSGSRHDVESHPSESNATTLAEKDRRSKQADALQQRKNDQLDSVVQYHEDVRVDPSRSANRESEERFLSQEAGLDLDRMSTSVSHSHNSDGRIQIPMNLIQTAR